MGRIVHFEIPADNPERAIGFYSKVFHWEAHKWDGPMPYWMISTGPKDHPGIDGAIMPRMQPGQGVNNIVQVDSLDDAMAAVEIAGGKVVTPKIPVPGVGIYANCLDTEGNSFGMMQMG
jgi:uncharacterized protein